MSNNIPRFLNTEDGKTVGTRPRLHIDEVYENGTVFDTVRVRPSLRTKLIKKAKRRLAELEELKAFADKKGLQNITRAELEAIFKD